MRLFVAINLAPAIREAIYDDAAPLRTATKAVRWVAASALHVTMKFLGEQDEGVVDALGASLRSVASRHAALHVETTRIGAFPNFRRPRVVWVGMTGERALQALARDIDRAFAPLGIAPETREFQAHLTLGRVKDELRPQEASAIGAAAESVRASREFAVRTVDLMRSELGPGGSRYSVMVAAPLHERGS